MLLARPVRNAESISKQTVQSESFVLLIVGIETGNYNIRGENMEKRTLRVEIYKKLLNYTCAHPECNNGTNIEAHHIRPLYKGGTDKFWNLISLCWTCHRTKKLHSNSDSKLCELYVYKSMHEARILGFYMDEQERKFQENYKRAIRNNEKMEADEKLVAEHIEELKVK